LQSQFIEDLPAHADPQKTADTGLRYFAVLMSISRAKFNHTVIDRIIGAGDSLREKLRLVTLKRAIARRWRKNIAQSVKAYLLRLRGKVKSGDSPENKPEPPKP